MKFAAMLSGGDHRSIGKSDAVVNQVLADPARFDELMLVLSNADPLVRGRAADAAEKITARVPALLQPYKQQLLKELTHIPDPQVRWHICQMLPRLTLTSTERRRAFQIIKSYLKDQSGIVRTFALQALFDLSLQAPAFADETRNLLAMHTATDTPAVRARSKRLWVRMQKKDGVK